MLFYMVGRALGVLMPYAGAIGFDVSETFGGYTSFERYFFRAQTSERRKISLEPRIRGKSKRDYKTFHKPIEYRTNVKRVAVESEIDSPFEEF